MGVAAMINGEQREGELLHSALEEAQRKAREWRRKANEAEAEAAKWEAIASSLEQLESKSRQPAALVNLPKPAAATRSVISRRPRGFWFEQIVVLLKMWDYPNQHTTGPTKKELCAMLSSKFPDGSEASIIQSIYNAIDTGKLIYRVDHLYLPDNAPARQFASSARDSVTQ